MTAQARFDLPDWPRLMPAPLAAQYLGIGETTLRAKGPAAKKIGARTLYDRNDLDRWADALGGQPLDESEEAAERAEVTRRFMEARNGSRTA